LENPKVGRCDIIIKQRKHPESYANFGLTYSIYNFVVSLNCVVSHGWIPCNILHPASYGSASRTAMFYKFYLNATRGMAEFCFYTLQLLALSYYVNGAQSWILVLKAEYGCVEMNRI
jgi:hypothetical protein